MLGYLKLGFVVRETGASFGLDLCCVGSAGSQEWPALAWLAPKAMSEAVAEFVVQLRVQIDSADRRGRVSVVWVGGGGDWDGGGVG